MAHRHTTPILTLAGLIAGCAPAGPPLAAVEGTVTLDGRPLPDAEVVFVPDPARGTAGREVSAYTDAAGRYAVPLDPMQRVGAVVGYHRVLVRDARMYLVPPAGVDPETGEPTAAAPAAPRPKNRVPLAYGDARQTPLTDVEVRPGTQTYDVPVRTH